MSNESVPVTPPDMVGAGMMQPAQPPMDLLGALRSQGNLPSGIMGALNAMGAGVFAGRGQQDPVAAQQMQQQRMQMDQMQMMQRVQERQQALQAKRQESALTISQAMLKHPSADVRAVGARGVVNYLKLVDPQNPPPQGVLEALTKGTVSLEDSNNILRDVALGLDDAMVLSRHPNIDSATLADYKKAAGNPKLLKPLGLESPEDRLKAMYDLQIKGAQAVEAGHPEIKGDARTVHEMLMQHRKLFGGKDYLEGTKESQQQAYDAATLKIKQDTEDKIRLQGQVQTDKLLAGIAARQSMQGAPKPLTPTQKIQMKKTVDTFQNQDRVLKSIKVIEDQIDTMDKLGALPTGDSVASQIAAKAYRETFLRGNKAVFTFKQLWGPLSAGQIDRGLFDEKNVRFKAAFEQQLGVVDHMPPAAAMKEYLQLVRELVLDKMRTDVATMEDLEFPEQVQNAVKRIYGPYDPTNTAVQPKGAGPLAQPKQADFRYNPTTGQLEPMR